MAGAGAGRTTPQWSTARRSLIDKGLIEPAGHGVLRFTMPTFAAFVRQVTGVEYRGPGHAGTLAPPDEIGLPKLPHPPQLEAPDGSTR